MKFRLVVPIPSSSVGRTFERDNNHKACKPLILQALWLSLATGANGLEPRIGFYLYILRGYNLQRAVGTPVNAYHIFRPVHAGSRQMSQ
ncbi:MAG: hypothetical protein EHM37_22325 [Deltaproteobacteria bacterium]|nr:MAG: hypothetical protein EHM37_22325 [Deltaproteobacteria bacterium]